MIERIDLIEREKFSFTYTRIVQAGIGMALVCVFFFGWVMGWSYYYKRNIAVMKTEIAALEEDRKELLKAQPTQIAEGSNAALQNIFMQTPPWANLLKDISSRLPNSVWLTGLKGASSKAELPKSGSSNANATGPPAASTGKSTFVLNGTTSNLLDLARFVAKIQQSPFVSKATLTNSRKEQERFTFEIICDMVIPNF